MKEIQQQIPNSESTYTQRKLSLNASLLHKIGAKDNLSVGGIADVIQYNLQAADFYPISRSTQNATGSTLLTQLYGQWKHRFTKRWTMNSGLAFLHLTLNGSTALEPRLGLSYQLGPTSSLNIA
ncbi:hypothetical protein [Spirosoma soli]|uniref:hypothetical protein n=1 Tax=Spirosoma soli TaxID=1770529 RepID=UPI0036D22799